VDDSGDLDPWLYTAMLTGIGELRAFGVELLARLVSADRDDLSLETETINSENARVREWMDRYPDGVKYCFELDAIHEDLDWLLSEWDPDVGVHYKNRLDLMRNAVVYHVHNYHYRIHAYRDAHRKLLEYKSGERTWQVVTAERRGQEYFDTEGLSEETKLFLDLDNFHRHESEKLREVTSFLKRFRYDLTRSLRQLALRQ
jgi:hypothetical protein